MTEAIWPETLTLMEYISRKFWLSSSRPGVKHKGHEAQCKDEQSVGPHELVSGHLAGHGQAQHDGDEVCEDVLRRFTQGVQHAALPQQVAEHQKAHQCYTGRSHEPGDDGHEILVSWLTLPFW